MKKTVLLREIREQGDAELESRVKQLEEQLFGFRMKRYTNQLENTMNIRKARRDIARIRTILAARKAGASSSKNA